MSELTFKTLPDAVGSTIHAEPFSITAEDLERFEVATWLDRAYPEDAPEFPEQIVEGFLLLSLVDPVSKMAGGWPRTGMWGLNYGLDKVRFISQVYVGDVVHPAFDIVEVKPKDEGYLVLRRCTFTVADAPRPAMVADWWTFVLPSGTLEAGRQETTAPHERA